MAYLYQVWFGTFTSVRPYGWKDRGKSAILAVLEFEILYNSVCL